MKLNPKKCEFARQRVTYLGHVISRDGLLVNGDNVKVIREFPTPTNRKALRSFLGVTGFYRSFVCNFSSAIAGPLYELSKKKTPFI